MDVLCTLQYSARDRQTVANLELLPKSAPAGGGVKSHRLEQLQRTVPLIGAGPANWATKSRALEQTTAYSAATRASTERRVTPHQLTTAQLVKEAHAMALEKGSAHVLFQRWYHCLAKVIGGSAATAAVKGFEASSPPRNITDAIDGNSQESFKGLGAALCAAANAITDAALRLQYLGEVQDAISNCPDRVDSAGPAQGSTGGLKLKPKGV